MSFGKETKCPECGSNISSAGTWACGLCGARGLRRQNGKREVVEDDATRLKSAQMALVNVMAGTTDPDLIKKAADLYARLFRLNICAENWFLVGDGDHRNTPSPAPWLLAEHVGILDEMVRDAGVEDEMERLAKTEEGGFHRSADFQAGTGGAVESA